MIFGSFKNILSATKRTVTVEVRLRTGTDELITRNKESETESIG